MLDFRVSPGELSHRLSGHAEHSMDGQDTDRDISSKAEVKNALDGQETVYKSPLILLTFCWHIHHCLDSRRAPSSTARSVPQHRHRAVVHSTYLLSPSACNSRPSSRPLPHWPSPVWSPARYQKSLMLVTSQITTIVCIALTTNRQMPSLPAMLLWPPSLSMPPLPPARKPA